MALTTRKIIKKIGCKNLELVRGEGYWYFVYDDTETGKYKTLSVMTMYLGDDIEYWVSQGKEFVLKMESE